jgi:hypothetical protein
LYFVLFVFGFESEAQVSQCVSLLSFQSTADHPSERKKKIPGKKKTIWQALESASSKTHLRCSVDYYAQQWTGSLWVLFVWIHAFVGLLNSALIWFVQLADCN